MKKTLLALAILAAVGIAYALPFATLPYAAVNNTTAISTTNGYATPIQAPPVYVTTGGLTATTAAAIISEHSLDGGTTWVSDTTNYLSSTSAGTQAVAPSPVNVTVNYRTRIVTTNNVSIGVINAN